MKKQEKISVIIPAKNEEENIVSLLNSIKRTLKKINARSEIIVIDGGSKDNTVRLGKSLADKVITQKNPGYGNALKEGFAASEGDYIVTMDADLSHDPNFLIIMFKNRCQAELIIASRYIHGGTAEMSIWRKLLSKTLNIFFVGFFPFLSKIFRVVIGCTREKFLMRLRLSQFTLMFLKN